MLLQISTSKCLRWRKNGVIASIYPDVLLSQLKVLDKDSKLKRTLGNVCSWKKNVPRQKNIKRE